MLKIYKTINDVTKEISTLEDGVWINMINPFSRRACKYKTPI